MGFPGIDPELEEEFRAVAEDAGCELYHVERQAGVLRVFLDREDGGVTHEHCETVSRQLSTLLDMSDWGTGRYVLEVSSPGLDRQLYRPRDYERFCGSLLRVTYSYLDGTERRKRTIVGRLVAFDAAASRLELQEVDSEAPLAVPMDAVHKARLEPEL